MHGHPRPQLGGKGRVGGIMNLKAWSSYYAMPGIRGVSGCKITRAIKAK
jgi:hypothetical protein